MSSFTVIDCIGSTSYRSEGQTSLLLSKITVVAPLYWDSALPHSSSLANVAIASYVNLLTPGTDVRMLVQRVSSKIGEKRKLSLNISTQAARVFTETAGLKMWRRCDKEKSGGRRGLGPVESAV